MKLQVQNHSLQAQEAFTFEDQNGNFLKMDVHLGVFLVSIGHKIKRPKPNFNDLIFKSF